MIISPTIFILTESQSLFKIVGNSVKWRSEESMVNAIGMHSVDYPNMDPIRFGDFTYTENNVLTAYLLKWIAQMSIIPKFFSRTALLNEKRHGFNKLLIFASNIGNVVAVGSETGKTIWSTFLKADCKKFEILGKDSDHLTLLLSCFVKGNSIIIKIDPFTGKIIQNIAVTRLVDVEERIIMTADSESHLQLLNNYQKSNLSMELMSWDFDKVKSTFSGYKHFENRAMKTWEIQFSPSETISTVNKADIGPVGSLGRVLGDRTVLYKYLNPNSITIATANSENSTIYIIDTISGAILEQLLFGGITDIHLVQNDNLVVLGFQRRLTSELMLQHEIAILELYESASPDQQYDSLIFNSYSQKARLGVLSQTFVTEYKFTAIGVTKTKFGITKKDFIGNFC